MKTIFLTLLIVAFSINIQITPRVNEKQQASFQENPEAYLRKFSEQKLIGFQLNSDGKVKVQYYSAIKHQGKVLFKSEAQTGVMFPGDLFFPGNIFFPGDLFDSLPAGKNEIVVFIKPQEGGEETKASVWFKK
ncbi:hypothetical protein [Jiulongibacter sp. NS-SX5]|uniref:hypothetical protein n=1 Tax=Jiulongibacter sp. NS-SX5 TaxID=3463854 RepID=UPI004057FB5D